MSDAYRSPDGHNETDDAVEERAQEERLRREAERLRAKDAKEHELVRAEASRVEAEAKLTGVFCNRFANRASPALERAEALAPGVAVTIVLGTLVVGGALSDRLLPRLLAVVFALAVVVLGFVGIGLARQRVVADESRWAKERFLMMDGFIVAIGASVDKGKTEIFFDVTLATPVPNDALAKLGDALATVVPAGTIRRSEPKDTSARERELRIATGETDAGLSMGIYRKVVTSFLPLLREYDITRVRVTSAPRSMVETVFDTMS
jgi:hypothetical protein